jgi:hypothetical protein
MGSSGILGFLRFVAIERIELIFWPSQLSFGISILGTAELPKCFWDLTRYVMAEFCLAPAWSYNYYPNDETGFVTRWYGGAVGTIFSARHSPYLGG